MDFSIRGRMNSKPTRRRRRIQMLHELANDDGYVALKRAAEDREVWRHRERGCKKNLLYGRRLLTDYDYYQQTGRWQM